MPKLVLASIAIVFLVLGALAALVARDVRRDSSNPPAVTTGSSNTQVCGATERARTSPMTSTDCPNGGATRDSVQRASGTTDRS